MSNPNVAQGLQPLGIHNASIRAPTFRLHFLPRHLAGESSRVAAQRAGTGGAVHGISRDPARRDPLRIGGKQPAQKPNRPRFRPPPLLAPIGTSAQRVHLARLRENLDGGSIREAIHPKILIQCENAVDSKRFGCGD